MLTPTPDTLAPISRKSRSIHASRLVAQFPASAKFRALITLAACLWMATILALAQTAPPHSPQASEIQSEAIQATTPLHVLQFNAELLKTPLAQAQKLTATFTVSGYSASFTPTAAMHYGHDYSLGAVTCVVAGNGESCSVDVTFQPTLPGGRRDAIFLSNGSTRLATLLVYGIGQAPFAAVQPGILTEKTVVAGNTSFYNYGTTIDENDTVYVATNDQNALYQITKDGTVSRISIPGVGEIQTLAIDGAGVLYLGGYSDNIITYDTVLGTQGEITVPGAAGNFQESITIDGVGDIFTLEPASNNAIVKELKPDGTSTNTTLAPAITQPNTLTTDADGNLFVGGYQINELTTGGVQTQINTIGASEGLAIDAAEILYATRYNPTGGVAELLPGDYSTAAGSIGGGSPLGLGLASDGSLAIGNYNVVDLLDRTRGSLDLGSQTIGVASAGTSMQILNIGNKPLTLSKVSLTGDGYALATSEGACASGTVLAPAASCNLSVTLTPQHGGSASGALTITSNSLYETTTQTTTLSGAVDGAYVTATPSPLNFPAQARGTTSGAVSVTLSNQGLTYSASIGTPVSSDPAFKPSLGSCTSEVAVGSACQMSITFSPTAIAHYSATITLPVSSVGSRLPDTTTTFTVNGDGTAQAAPVVSLSPTSLAFGSQTQGTSSAATAVTLKNTGNAALTVSVISITGANPGSFSQTTTCGATLAANASCGISVTFTPASVGALTATLTVADTASGSPHTVALTGTGTAAPAPVLSLTPALVSFGSQTQNTSSPSQIVTLRNTGNATLTVTGITLSGSGLSSFTSTTTCGSSLAAGVACTVSVTFTPKTVGALTATLTVVDNAAGSPHSVSLSGTGTAVPAPVASLSPSSLDFGDVTTGTSSAPKLVTLKNTGDATLTLTGFAISGSATFSETNNCGGSLAAGAGCTLTLVFAPQSLGAQTATLAVNSNTSGIPPVVLLTGTGTAPPVPIVTLTPGSLAFGGQTQGSSSAPQVVTIKNTGTAPLSGIAISLTETQQTSTVRIGAAHIGKAQANAITSTANYSATTTCGTSLDVGSSCTISVVFTPTTTGSLPGTLLIGDDASGEPQSVALTGTGTAIPPGDFTVAATPSSATVSSGGAASFNIAVSTSGGPFTSTVTLAASGLPNGATAAFTPASITPGSGPGTSVLTIQTATTVAADRNSTPFWPLGSPALALLIFAIPKRLRKQWRRRMMLGVFALLSLGAAVSLTACGSGLAVPQSGTSYTVTVTGTSGSDVHTTTVQLTVK